MLPVTTPPPIWGSHAYRNDSGKRRLTYQLRRYFKLICFVAGLVLLGWFLLPRFARPLVSLGKIHRPPSSLRLNLSHLDKHNLTPEFTYSRRLIRVKKDKNAKRESMTLVNDTLYTTPQTLFLDNITDVAVTSLPPITLSIPWHKKKKLSIDNTASISIGVATSLQRLDESINHWSHWLPNTGAYLHVLVPPDQHHNISVPQQTLHQLGINANVTISKLPYPHAYFSLLKHLYENRLEETRWIAVFDDDTFVPSLQDLVTHLHRNYDETAPRMVGSLSDSKMQLDIFGILTYGGGGIFLTLPLAAQLASPKIFQACMESGAGQGDRIMTDCLYNFSKERPMFDSLLHQMDIKGDPSGYFESGRKMLTIHHWKSESDFFSVDMPSIAKIAKICGDDGMLMRFQFSDGVVLSNGYSIAEYGEHIEEIDFNAVELTWLGDRGQFIHQIGPLRDRVPVEHKKPYLMVETTVVDGVGILQTYFFRTQHEIAEPRDGIIELMWLYD